MQLLKQSSTQAALVFLMVDSTDHVTGKTGLSPTVTIRKEGGAFASPAGSVTEIASGWYQVAGNATDTGTLGSLLLHATGTGADPTDMHFQVVGFDPFLAAAGALMPTTAGRTLDVSAAGNAGIDWANVEAPTTTVGLSGTTVKTATDLATLLGTPAGASVSADVAAVKADTGSLVTQVGTAGAGLTALGDARIANLDATVSSRLASASYTAPLDAAGTRSAVGLASANLDTQLAAIDDAIDTEVGAIKAKTDNLPADPSSASTIAASFAALNNLSSAQAQTAAAAALAAYDPPTRTEATADKDAIIAALPAAPDNAGIAAVKAKTDNLPSDPADASDIAASFATVNGTLATLGGYIDTEVGAIKTKTDQLTFASGSVIAKLAADGLDSMSFLDFADATAAKANLHAALCWNIAATGLRRVVDDKDADEMTVYRADGTTPATVNSYTSTASTDDVGAAT